MAVSQEMPQPSITEISLKSICIRFHSNLPGANELMNKASVMAQSPPTALKPAKNCDLTHFQPVRGLKKCGHVIEHKKISDYSPEKHTCKVWSQLDWMKLFQVIPGNLRFSPPHVMLSSMSTNSTDFQVKGCCLVTFVWCYSKGEMQKCLVMI